MIWFFTFQNFSFFYLWCDPSVIQAMIWSLPIPVLSMLGVWELWNIKHTYLTTLELYCAVAIWYHVAENVELFLLLSNSALQRLKYNIQWLKIPTTRRQTSRLFTQRSQGVQLGVTGNKSNEWQGRGLEPWTTRLQVQHPNHSATPPPYSLFEFIWHFLEKNALVYPQALHHQL